MSMYPEYDFFQYPYSEKFIQKMNKVVNDTLFFDELYFADNLILAQRLRDNLMEEMKLIQNDLDQLKSKEVLAHTNKLRRPTQRSLGERSETRVT